MHRHGGILLEATIGLAIFAITALVVLASSGQSAQALLIARDRVRAMDLARTASARLEVGLGDVRTLSGPVPPWAPPIEDLIGEDRWGDALGELFGGAEADPDEAEEDDEAFGLFEANPDEGLSFGAERDGWMVEITVEPTDIAGLSVVRTTASREGSSTARATLVQIARLSGEAEAGVGSFDELSEELMDEIGGAP